MSKQKYYTGDKLEFLFLGAKLIGTVVSFREVDVHGVYRPRYTIESGGTRYPVAELDITRKLS